MKLLLFSSSSDSFTFSPPYGGKKCIPLPVIKFSPQNSERNEKDVLAKRLRYLNDTFPNKEWTLNLEICFNDMRSPKLDLALEGDLLKILHDTLYFGCNSEPLQVSIQAEVSSRKCNIFIPPLPAVITAINMIADTKHIRYIQKDVPLPEVLVPFNCQRLGQEGSLQNVWNFRSELDWSITVELEVNNLVDIDGLLPLVSEKNAKILEEKLFCDFEIISCDGISVPCHKVILSGSSEYFKKKCAGKPNKPSTNAFTMDMTEESINALLKFIYSGEVHKPMLSSITALELFQAGYKYGIVGLEKVMGAIFLQKSSQWYNVDVAFELLRFLASYKGVSRSGLTKKAIQALAANSDELSNCILVKEAFTKSPLLAVQMSGMMVYEMKNRVE